MWTGHLASVHSVRGLFLPLGCCAPRCCGCECANSARVPACGSPRAAPRSGGVARVPGFLLLSPPRPPPGPRRLLSPRWSRTPRPGAALCRLVTLCCQHPPRPWPPLCRDPPVRGPAPSGSRQRLSNGAEVSRAPRLCRPSLLPSTRPAVSRAPLQARLCPRRPKEPPARPPRSPDPPPAVRCVLGGRGEGGWRLACELLSSGPTSRLRVDRTRIPLLPSPTHAALGDPRAPSLHLQIRAS